MNLNVIETSISRYKQTPIGIVKLFEYKNLVVNDNSLFISKIGLQELFYHNNFLYTNNDNGDGLLIDLMENRKIEFSNEYLKQLTNNYMVSFFDGKTKILNRVSQESIFYPYKILKTYFYEELKLLVIDCKSEKSIMFSKIDIPNHYCPIKKI
ncbi:MAG: hypothetical protein IPM74_11995 [Crocinitomicaceae bacterium]|nr:hypothetical protein [Crocinitomicaceae bacterium]